jgi:hypothetical protein
MKPFTVKKPRGKFLKNFEEQGATDFFKETSGIRNP